MVSFLRTLGLNYRKSSLSAADAIALGDTARDRRDWTAAADSYRKALEIDPTLTSIWVQYGHALKEGGYVEDAIAAYQRASEGDVKDNAEKADILVHLGHTLKRLNRRDEALVVFQTVMNLTPEDQATANEIFFLNQTVFEEMSTPETLTDPTVRLDDLISEIVPGVSVVTCARNRTDNLLKALPSWLTCGEVDEVIIVDWTSDEPVIKALEQADLLDPRVKVLRIEGEARWILSTAFNAGFRAAKHSKILKADADIILKDGFFARNILAPGTFLAGDWRNADPGQEFINGFFFIARDALMAANGFNEMITTYGWDDDDLYDRLKEAGLNRIGVEVDTIAHLEHDDAARTGASENTFDNARAELWSRTDTKINANRIMCFLMPQWRKGMWMQPFSARIDSDQLITAQRSMGPPYVIPDPVRADVEHYTTIEYLSGKFGYPAYKLTRKGVEALMGVASLEAVTPLSVAVAQTHPDRVARDGNYLIATLDAALRMDTKATAACLAALDEIAAKAGFGLVISDDEAAALSARLASEQGEKASTAFLNNAPGAATISLGEARALSAADFPRGECRTIRLTCEMAAELVPDLAAPQHRVARDTLYIDAQHGLGNRLRAIASAASIAGNSDRELVIVWEPDYHCDCAFSDLFDYAGPIVEASFIEEARDKGHSVFNYMEIEDGADRNAGISLTSGIAAYARSAYVLNSPLSTWDTENAFLRALTPTRNVMDLIDDVRAINDVSVHVRMEAGPGLDGHRYDSPENWPEADHVTLQHWREKSHYSNFMARLDQMIERGEVETIFLAADLPETYAAFAQTYGDRIAYLERNVWDRSREQMYYALADAMLLSGGQTMLGSNWSSFSEIALRLSRTFNRIQLSGVDF